MKVRTILLAPVCVAAVLYVGLCGYLFAEQRHAIYHPRAIVLGDPPTGSGYATLNVAVPGIGVLKHWWMPPGRAGMPTIVFFHGNAGDRSSFLEQGELLHRRGFGAVLVSYPGYSGNPGTPSEDALMANARAALAAVGPKAGPIIVWGHSLGSGVAARMATEGHAAGLVLEAPYTSLPDIAARIYPYIPVHWLMLDRFNTRALVDRITVPVLIFHSTDDPQIPFAMGRELADALGKHATFVRLEGAGHYPHHSDLSATVVQWARAHCVAPALCNGK
jgi:pimeloyl-ACP methyl ester carboxylesterase